MTPALRRITTLKLKVKCDPNTSMCEDHAIDSTTSSINNRQSIFPASCVSIEHVVFVMLVKVLPNLRHLCMEGCYGDTVFNVLGRFCPHLADLQFEAISVPVSALEGIAACLPKLKCLTLASPKLQCTKDKLELYVGSCLLALQLSDSFTRMVLNFEKDVELCCKPGLWQQVPKNLQELICLCGLHGLPNAPALLKGLKKLAVRLNSSCNGTETPVTYQIFDILASAPGLKHFNAQGLYLGLQGFHSRREPQTWKVRFDPLMQAGFFLLNDCVRRGLHFVAPNLVLMGSSESLQSSLTMLPILSTVRKCTLQFNDNTTYFEPTCLIQISRVFPSLVQLTLQGKHSPANSPLSSSIMVLLGPLVGCSFLRKLRVRLQLDYTLDDLVEVCRSMVALKELGYIKHESIDPPQLKSTLLALGRDIELREYSS